MLSLALASILAITYRWNAAPRTVKNPAITMITTNATKPIPIHPSFCFHVINTPRESKCLTDRDVVLRRFNAIHRVQVASNVESHRSNGSRIAQTDSHRVCIVADEVADVNRPVYIATVVEQRSAQSLLDSQWKA